MANKVNQSKEYRIYIKESKSWVDVNKEFYTNYYLCFITWEQIAVDMGYELRYIHKLHGKALDEVKVPASYEGGHEMT